MQALAVPARRADPDRHGPRARRDRLRPDDPPLPPRLSDASRLVVEVGRRGRLVVGEPYFTPGVPIVLDTKGIGDIKTRRPRGRAHRPRPGAGRARLGPADRDRERARGAARRARRAAAVRAAHAARAGSRDREPRRPARPADLTRSIPTPRRTSTTRSRSGARTTASARGCTSPTSRTSCPRERRSTRGPRERAFSTYVPGNVAPMLPHELADDLCSLRPHQDRLCVTVEIPPHGEPRFYRSVIRSDARLTYGQAQRRDAEPHILEALDLNDELAQALRAKRFARGALAGADARGRLSLRRPRRCRRGVARGRAARAHARGGADDPRERARRRVPRRQAPRDALPRARAARPALRSSTCSRSSRTSACRRRRRRTG